MLQSFERIFELGDPPDYEPDPASSIAARAQREGRDPLELAYDLMLVDDGRAFLYFPILNYDDGNLDAAGEMLAHPHTVVGLADGGAHVGTICDASFPTTLLTHWGRDRERGRLDVPFLVHRHTQATARTVGLLDRGVLAPGYRADVNVIDFDRLTARRPEMRYDLPAGGKRLVQVAEGYVATIANGEVTYESGEATGPLPGRLIRGPQPAPGGALRMTTTTRSSPRSKPHCEWRGADVGDSYVFQLTDVHVAELEAAVDHAQAQVDDVLDITRELFPLPTLGPELVGLTRELIDGRGVVLIRGVPVDRNDKARGIGDLLGRRHPPRVPVAPERQGPSAR